MTQATSLQSILTKSFWKGMGDVYTSIPGVVVGVNLSALSVDVQPALNIKKEDGSVTPRPVIANVPLSVPSGSEGGMTHPVSVGDSVYLIFSMEGIDTWKRGQGMPTTPSNFRKFDKKDCIAIPIKTFSTSVNSPDSHIWPHNPDDVVLYHNLGTAEETEIRLHRAGGVTINTNQGVTVNAAEFVEVNTKDYTVNTETYTVMASGAVGIYGSRVDIN